MATITGKVQKSNKKPPKKVYVGNFPTDWEKLEVIVLEESFEEGLRKRIKCDR